VTDLEKSIHSSYEVRMNAFLPRLDILPPAQRKVWQELTQIPKSFTLYGGTAVALHLGHRQSVDFDFFCFQDFAPLELAAALKLFEGGTVIQIAPNTLTMSIDRGGPVKLSFFGVRRLKRVEQPLVAHDNGLQIASLLDLAGTKTAVVQQRAEPKDYIDIDAILKSGQIDLSNALAAALFIYGPVFSPLNALKALTYFDEPQLFALSDDIKQRLVDAVRKTDLDCLPLLASGYPK
jgi:Nucleotidyl transferase AbiEii toxin, Type IV TA system